MKVACSIKLADQREGTDLDPSNTKYQPRGEGPADGPIRGPITATAVVARGTAMYCPPPTRLWAASTHAVSDHCLPTADTDVVCAAGDTVDWGYLKAGDQQYGDAQKQYDLLGDEVLNLPVPPPPPMSAAEDGLPDQQLPQHAGEPVHASLTHTTDPQLGMRLPLSCFLIVLPSCTLVS